MGLSLLSLAGLGAFHGLNPGMGWLFAVALGMQEGRQRGVWRAMIPLTIGHCLAIGAALAAGAAAGLAISPRVLSWSIGLLLVALGVRQLYRHMHFRWASMRVGLGGLTWWSFLMATAHGAGLMALPFFVSMAKAATMPGCHAHMAPAEASLGFMAIAAHGAGYLAATVAAAWIVVQYLGLGILRKGWINVDLIWAAALLATGTLTIVL